MNNAPGQSGLVSIGLVTWNNEKDLPPAIEGLREQIHPRMEIIVVDNASSDHSLEVIRGSFPEATIIANERNLGYCAAQNQAIRASLGEYYLALNPDVRMLPGFIERLVAALEAHPDCGSAVGKFWQTIEAEPKVLDGAGLFIDRRRHQNLRGHGEVDRGQYDRPEEVFGADGAAPLHRKKMLEDVSILGEYFDEQFFIYKEDVDLTWRAKIFGWKCYYEPRATAFHDRSFRPGLRAPIPSEIRRFAVRNRYLMILKNESKEGWRRDWWRILWYDLKILAYILVLERSSMGALKMLWQQWPRAKKLREEVWSHARVDGRDTLDWFTE